jgi:phosphomannomutase
MSEPTLVQLTEAARAWQQADPDPSTRAEIDALLAEGDPVVLRECFGQRLQFGTAGIRGRMGPGPGQLNRALIRQVTGGLGRYLLREVQGAGERGVVVGFDGRHNSRVFAQDAARVLAGLGLRVHLFDDVVPTPVLAHAVTFLRAAGGVMVTASHNPPADNGYKVYWENGAQIIAPHDAGISSEIDAVGSPDGVDAPPLTPLVEAGRVGPVPGDAFNDYERKVLALRVHSDTGALAVYSAMHGVGYASLVRVLSGAGHQPVASVREQQEPDGDFPTVSFPNPEEPGALDRAVSLATARGADVVLAHDPDADRLAVAIPDGRGGWQKLTGNEVGVLLADDLLTHGDWRGGTPMVATTIVSTSLLGRIAEAHGAVLAETLTGFKWIANAALAHDGPFVLGFEEALGYSAGAVVRDKDGVSTAMLFLDLVSWCKARGVSLRSHLAALYRRYGYAASAQHSIKRPGLEGADEIRAIMAGLRAEPPASLGGRAVRRIRDIQTGEARTLATGATAPIHLPRSNVLAFDLEGGCRVLARPSGTEPKLKFYFEATEQLSDGEPLAQARARAEAVITALEADLLERLGLA